MLLALIRNDLVSNWQASLPADAPNRFIINIQPEQVKGVNQFFQNAGIDNTAVFPMVRGRLISRNAQVLSGMQWKEERAKRLAEREFNLSWAATMQADNVLVAGKWWSAEDYGKPYLSLEQDLAKTLGIKLGDQLVFDIAGQPLKLTVTSLRKVEWDTMRANFFAVTPPGLLEQYPANYISSFHLPVDANDTLNNLIREYPNLTVIDIAALMLQVRNIMQRMSDTIQYVFIFSLISGAAVLYAALVATQRERIREATLMRVFGASRQQVNIAYLAEFVCIGLIAAVVASLVANGMAYYLSSRVMDIPFKFNFTLALFIMLLSALVIPFAAWFGFRKPLSQSPRQLLNSI
jgi:putative ABC transport system permease protein